MAKPRSSCACSSEGSSRSSDYLNNQFINMDHKGERVQHYFKVPKLNFNPDRVTTTLPSTQRLRTLPSLMNSDRHLPSQHDYCVTFRKLSTRMLRTPDRHIINQANREIKSRYFSHLFNRYQNDKKLVNQLTTKGLRSHFKPKLKKLRSIEQVIESIDQDGSPTRENMKIADFLLNYRKEEPKQIEKLSQYFQVQEHSPAKLKHFKKNVISFAHNLKTYIDRNQKSKSSQQYI